VLALLSPGALLFAGITQWGVCMPPDHQPAAAATIPAAGLRAYAQEILLQLGARPAAAAEVADHLIASDLAGVRSHGVALLPWYHHLISTGQVHPEAEFEVLGDRGAAVSLDGHFGLGQVCANAAVRILTGRARRHGLACATGKNAGHIGRLGHYTTEFARRGLIGLVVINYQGAGQDVAPFGGREGRLSNDPLSLGAPAATTPVIADMALSTAAMVKILHMLDHEEDRVPEGWLLDSAGAETTDPTALQRGGTLLPLGGRTSGHKGFGLLVLADILAGALSGGGVCRPEVPDSFTNAFFMLALDVGWLADRPSYDAAVEKLRDHVKSSAPREGAAEILFPGEREARETARQLVAGVQVERVDWDRVAALGDRLGVAAPVL
jgi:hydroxycarboxylate dehydrogenase B